MKFTREFLIRLYKSSLIKILSGGILKLSIEVIFSDYEETRRIISQREYGIL